ncbi:hypothetical protein R0K19_28990, partial [Bacillus sp. SIMBA_161]
FSEAYRSLSVGRVSSLLTRYRGLRGLSNPLIPQESSKRFSKYLDNALIFNRGIVSHSFYL